MEEFFYAQHTCLRLLQVLQLGLNLANGRGKQIGVDEDEVDGADGDRTRREEPGPGDECQRGPAAGGR